MRGGYNMQMSIPFTGVVKKLVIANLSIYFLIVLLGFSPDLLRKLFNIFGMMPATTVLGFWIWQPLTYMFLHSSSDIFHVVFNMLILWMFGSELEQRWGSKFFATYYFACGVGAAIIYIFGVLIYTNFLVGAPEFETCLALRNHPLCVPVIGASGAIFGLFVAYGIVFGERMIYFMMIFPMKAKFFVLILGAIEVVTLLNSGFGNNVANLCHIGGIVSGFLFLLGYTKWQGRKVRRTTKKHGRKLKLVVDNERNSKDKGGGPPKYWN